MAFSKTSVRVRKIHAAAALPQYMTDGASGCDAIACLDAPVEIGVGKRMAVPTGLAFEIPEGFEIQVRPRSGFAFKQGLTVINAPGTIDSDYRGEVKVLLINLGESHVTIAPGDRIAQFVLQRVERITWEETNALEDSARASGGFGSTGLSAAPLV